jgi:hypothetical protein
LELDARRLPSEQTCKVLAKLHERSLGIAVPKATPLDQFSAQGPQKVRRMATGGVIGDQLLKGRTFRVIGQEPKAL